MSEIQSLRLQPLPPKVQARIERLVHMNDRREIYLLKQDRDGLLQLAAEYSEMGMPRMAAIVQTEAESL